MAEVKTVNVSISIGDLDISSDHKNFSSLDIKRTVSDSADQFTLSVLDDTAFTIETLLLKGKNEITINYKDDDGNQYKKLTGSVIKLKNSFIDNRNMLTLEGYVSLSVSQKFEASSASWNTFPIFDWEKITGITQLGSKDETFEMPWTTISSFWEAVVEGIDGSKYLQIVQSILYNALRIDSKSGEYYIDTEANDFYKKHKAYVKKGVFKQTGSVTLPVNISKLIQVLLFGGKFKDIFPELDNRYSASMSDLTSGNLACVKVLATKFGDIPALSDKYVKGKWEEDLTPVDDELIQNRESNLTFIYNKLLGKCVKIKDKKFYANYRLNFKPQADGNIKVDFEYVDASKVAKTAAKAQYVYYGAFEPIKNYGLMTSFSADINVLTSMITSGQNTSETSDISNMNLVTGETRTVSPVIDSSEIDESPELQNAAWGIIKFRLAEGTHTDTSANITSIFQEAQAQCYKAQATITGFNMLEPMDIIDIAVAPVNINGTLQLHHTSGKYYILSVQDTISDGTFQTKLELIKNISSTGRTRIAETYSSSTLKSTNAEISTYVTSESPTTNTTSGSSTGSSGGGHSSGGGRHEGAKTNASVDENTMSPVTNPESNKKKETVNISNLLKTIVSTITSNIHK